MASRCGCYYLVPSLNGFAQREYLPLLQSSFHSTILSNTSRTVLTQKFTNPSKDTPIAECNYTFPLYDGVSVVSFTCRIGTTILRGVVKEKFKAKQIFDESVAKGETAGLFEQSMDAADVFNTKLGNIPAGETVFVEVTYVGELKAGDGESTRFTIPTSIAPRYDSNGGSHLGSAGSAQVHNGIRIVVDVNVPDGSIIKSVQSPSHPISVLMGLISTARDADPVMSKASATLALGEAELGKDFVLIVQRKDTGLPKAILETHPTISNQRAIMATLVPKFSLPPCRPEIVFVADRSGSMGSNISQLKQAMNVFLKSMPAGVKFNICSFGTQCSFLWEQSQTYDQSTLEQASRHVETFNANFGGTETFRAIKATIDQRWKDIPLEVMLLTDGDIWQQEDLFVYLNREVETSKGNIRVFPLGIGNGVSHSLIEGVARAGNGFSQAVQNGERLDSAVVRMLRGALSPHITDYTLEVKYGKSDDDEFDVIDKVTEGMKVLLDDQVKYRTSDVDEFVVIDKHIDGMKVLLNDQGTATEKPKISPFDPIAESEKVDAQLGTSKLPEIPTPKLLQAPHNIPPLFSSSRASVYILMSPETIERNPTSVIFKAKSEHGPIELEIPIEVLPEKGQTIHQLAAKKATQELEEGRGWVFDAEDQNGHLIGARYPSSFEDLIKKEAVRLGEKFQIAGKWCSFVAVAANTKEIDTTSRSSEFTHRHPGSSGDLLQDFDFDSFLQDPSANGSAGNTPQYNIVPISGGNGPLQDYQMQLMLLEQQNKKRKMMARQGPTPSDARGGPPLFRRKRKKACGVPSSPDNLVFAGKQTISGGSQPSPSGEAVLKTSAPDHAYQQAGYQSRSQPHARSLVRLSLGGQQYQRSAPKIDRNAALLNHPSQSSALEIGEDWETACLLIKLHGLIALQNFNGSWPTEKISEINKFLGKEVGSNAHGRNNQLWLTAVVVLFMEIKLADESDTWELVVEKAREWMLGEGDMGMEALEEEAKKFVSGL